MLDNFKEYLMMDSRLHSMPSAPVAGTTSMTAVTTTQVDVTAIMNAVLAAMLVNPPPSHTDLFMKNDRIFTIKLGLSQSLMVQEGTHNPNATLKG